MSLSQFPKSPNKVHPTIPSAVGSRESLAQEGRNKIEEQTNRELRSQRDRF